MESSEKPATTIRPTRIDSFVLDKDFYESSSQTVPFRTRQHFPNQRSTGQIQRLNHETTNLIAEAAQLNEKHVQVQRNKISFPRAPTKLESARSTYNSIH